MEEPDRTGQTTAPTPQRNPATNHRATRRNQRRWIRAHYSHVDSDQFSSVAHRAFNDLGYKTSANTDLTTSRMPLIKHLLSVGLTGFEPATP